MSDFNLTYSLVEILHSNEKVAGTGFLVDLKGHIVTCTHVVLDKKYHNDRLDLLPNEVKIRFHQDKERIIRKAKLIGESLPIHKGDITILRLVGDIPPRIEVLPLGESGNSGESVNSFHTIGFPRKNKFFTASSSGKISNGYSRTTYGFNVKELVDDDENIINGFSGAPVLNRETRNIIGMISWISSPEEKTLKFRKQVAVIPSETIIKSLPYKYKLRPVDISRLPKTRILSKFPRIVESSIIGRRRQLNKLFRILRESNSPIQLNGIGGVGKTSFLKVFVSEVYNKGEFSNILWIDFNNNIIDSFLSDEALLSNLNKVDVIEKLRSGFLDKEQAFEDIWRSIIAINGKNLLVIDNIEENVLKYRDKIFSNNSWRVVVSSRKQLIGFESIELPLLEEKDSIRAFKYYAGLKFKKISIDEKKKLDSLMSSLYGHPLAIELFAKSFKESKSLSIDELLSFFNRRENLKDSRIKVKTLYDKVDLETNLDECLAIAYDVSPLSEKELHQLAFFCMMPPQSLGFPFIKKLVFELSEGDTEIILDLLIKKGWIKEQKQDITSVERSWRNTFFCHPVIQKILAQKIPRSFFALSEYILALSDIYVNYTKTPESFIFALRSEGFPEHLQKWFSEDILELSYAMLLSRYAHLQVHLYNLELAKKAGETIHRIYNSISFNSNREFLEAAKVYINLSFVFKEVDINLAINKIEFSLDLLSKCTEDYKDNYFYFIYIRALYELSSLFIEANLPEKAIFRADEAIKLGELGFGNLQNDIFSLYRNKFIAYHKLDDVKSCAESINLANKYLEDHLELLDEGEKTEVKLQDANYYFASGDLVQCMTLLHELMEHLKLVKVDFVRKHRLSTQVSRIYFSLGFIEKAIIILQDSFEQAVSSGLMGYKLIETHLDICEYNMFLGREEIVKKHFDLANLLINENGIPKTHTTMLVSFYLKNAMILRYLEKNESAYNYSSKAQQLVIDNSIKIDDVLEAKIINSITLDLVNLVEKSNNSSLILLKEQLQLLEKFAEKFENKNINKYLSYYCYDTIGTAYSILGEPIAAQACYVRSLTGLKRFYNRVNPNHYYIRIVENRLKKIES